MQQQVIEDNVYFEGTCPAATDVTSGEPMLKLLLGWRWSSRWRASFCVLCWSLFTVYRERLGWTQWRQCESSWVPSKEKQHNWSTCHRPASAVAMLPSPPPCDTEHLTPLHGLQDVRRDVIRTSCLRHLGQCEPSRWSKNTWTFHRRLPSTIWSLPKEALMAESPPSMSSCQWMQHDVMMRNVFRVGFCDEDEVLSSDQ